MLECLKNDVDKELSKSYYKDNIEFNKDHNDRNETTEQDQKNHIIEIIQKSCGSNKTQIKDNKTPDSLLADETYRKKNCIHPINGLSNEMLKVLHSDIIKDKTEDNKSLECSSNNSTKIDNSRPRESLFELKIEDDEDTKINSCNKTDYNITIVYLPEKENKTCKEKQAIPKQLPTKDCNSTCQNNCHHVQEILRKLYLTELLETKKLKHKLIRIYLERKKRKLKEEEIKNAFRYARETPPLFNQTDMLR